MNKKQFIEAYKNHVQSIINNTSYGVFHKSEKITDIEKELSHLHDDLIEFQKENNISEFDDVISQYFNINEMYLSIDDRMIATDKSYITFTCLSGFGGPTIWHSVKIDDDYNIEILKTAHSGRVADSYKYAYGEKAVCISDLVFLIINSDLIFEWFISEMSE